MSAVEVLSIADNRLNGSEMSSSLVSMHRSPHSKYHILGVGGSSLRRPKHRLNLDTQVSA